VKYALDTNAVSALMRGDPAFTKRLRGVSRADVAIPQPVLAEIAYGIARLPRSKRRTALKQRFELICLEIGRASWTDGVSDAFGEIKATLEREGKRIQDFDAAIAAHAVALKATLVTANAKHMVRISELEIEDWSTE